MKGNTMKHMIIYLTSLMLVTAPVLIQAMPVSSEPSEQDQDINIQGGGYGATEIVILTVCTISLFTLFDDNDDNDIYGAIGAGILLGIGIVYMSFAIGQSVAGDQSPASN